jgi:hypothetical protein
MLDLRRGNNPCPKRNRTDRTGELGGRDTGCECKSADEERWIDGLNAYRLMSLSVIEAEVRPAKGRYDLDGSRNMTLSPDTIIATYKRLSVNEFAVQA